MKLASITDDRKKLIKELEKATGLKSKYMGAPSFEYEVGPYTVGRNGDITIENEEADEAVLEVLVAKELIVSPEDADQTVTIISLPMNDFDGRSLKNLVFMLSARSKLLSKAVGHPGFYKVSENLVKALEEKVPQTSDDFMKVLDAAGQEDLEGLVFEEGKLGFSFPCTHDPEKIRVYMQLTELMGEMARSQHRVKAAKCKGINEKYAFRTWLMNLGMIGDEYRTARRILLHNLGGNSAYRTKEQRDVAHEKMKQKRKAEREAASERAFDEL